MTDVMERLERVERENRRMKRAGAAVLLLAGAALLAGQAAPKGRTTIEAQEIVLRDGDGKARLKLTASEHGGQIGFFDAAEKPRIGIGAMDIGPNLTMYDENRKARILLGSGSTQTIDHPGLVIWDADGKEVFAKH